MHTLGVLEARQRFPERLDRARDGEDTLIARHGHPVAALAPLWRRHRAQRQALLALKGSGRACWPDHRPPSAGSGGPVEPLDGGATLALGSAVAIDATVLIPWLRGDAGGRRHEPLITAIAAGHWRGVLSMATLRTLVEGPLLRGDETLAARYEAVFSDPAAWTLVSLPPQVALAAARLQRPGSGPALGPDGALELASALHGGATAMISRDPRLLAALPLPARPPLP
ncbi:prevent-host-death family protein [Cyanobium sp. Copco_Reservoir_LC18]|uniref:type II toxin-antitoxin system Phd/YefM family antitoxin n=1 Tax=Cyanobium sp. Copco_Reservoir_LC18 TaxID=1328305 RepID=UPI00135B23B1|nr:type II toxin-antitoxin system Phd/YefM family antitoxin [Cyanobium sp. Copco_Reservoir_LC18]KAF0653475.1 prevent-host-death family protein [Cyanobium sp. Copco_Reservoir_LC18]